MSRPLQNVLVSAMSIIALVLVANVAHASKYENSPLDPIQKMVDRGEYNQAIVELEGMLADDPDDADVLSLLGYSYRKQQRYGEALGYYQRALDIDPEHRATNEYLGQLYLETDQLQKAQERLAVLDSACFLPCNEYTTLKHAIETYQQ
ncbi:MAG: tetratricopeptide repeat protein [Pseudomonadota bacterium]